MALFETMNRFGFNERSSGSIEFDVVDRDGQGVPVAGIQFATLTLFDWDTGAGWSGESPRPGIINGRDSQDVKNANDVEVTDPSGETPGHVLWNVQPEDNVIVTDRRQAERHRAMFHFEWSSGSFDWECELVVKNLRLEA